MSEHARPFYSRLLRLNHLRLRGPGAFALFEGSIGVAGLLVLAEIVSSWGLLAIPATVALMVKLNDVVAGSVVRPLAFAHMSAPGLADGVIVGRSPVPRPGRPTAEIFAGDAVADPAARTDTAPTARGQASSIARGVAVVPSSAESGQCWPSPGRPVPQPSLCNTDSGEIDNGTVPLRADPTARRGRGNEGRFTT